MNSSKLLKYTIFFLIIFCFAFSANILFAGQKIRIATFNCEFLIKSKVHKKFGYPLNLKKNEDRNLWNQPGYRDRKFIEATNAVAGFIQTINADILILTEIGDTNDFNILINALSNTGLSYPYTALCDSSDPTRQHVGVLSKINLQIKKYNEKIIIPGREFYLKELDDTDEGDTGISKGMHLILQINNKTAHLFAVHLKSERGGHEGDAQRIAQASIVRRNYLPYLNNGDYVIVAGDLNDGRGEPALKRIRGLDDIQPDLIQTGLYSYFSKTNYGNRWTYEYLGERNQIDHILISRNIKSDCKKGGINTSVLPQTNPLVSDHRPLIVDLNFR